MSDAASLGLLLQKAIANGQGDIVNVSASAVVQLCAALFLPSGVFRASH